MWRRAPYLQKFSLAQLVRHSRLQFSTEPLTTGTAATRTDCSLGNTCVFATKFGLKPDLIRRSEGIFIILVSSADSQQLTGELVQDRSVLLSPFKAGVWSVSNMLPSSASLPGTASYGFKWTQDLLLNVNSHITTTFKKFHIKHVLDEEQTYRLNGWQIINYENMCVLGE